MKILSYLFLVIFFSSCQKLEWNNPFDSKCPKEIWTPTDFKVVQEGTTVKLSWVQPINNISGFKLTKKVDTGTTVEMQISASGSKEYLDNTLTGGKLHTYTIVAYAGNNQSNILSATITPQGPASGVTTTAVGNITATTVISGGTITNDGGSPITARGVCWSTNANPTIAGTKTVDGTGIGTFSSAVSALTPNTTYFLRAYATNSVSTVYGNEVSFKTPFAPIQFNNSKTYGSLTDVEGNTYKTIQIDTQLWMAENLRTTKYRDGTSITLVTDNSVWANLTTPGYCWYNNDATTYKTTYGALYNWYSIITNNICPTGWHVPTDEEWTTLSNFIGSTNVAGGKMKETGPVHWLSPNSGATNETGFTALPGGYRDFNGTFNYIGFSGNWWSSLELNAPNAWFRYMSYDYSNIYKSYENKQDGFSVRCISGDLAVPTVSTSALTNITSTTAFSGGTISIDGGSPVTARGVCWSTTQNPTISNSKTADGTGIGQFTSNLTGLTAGMTYYVKAYATNSAGTAYGQEEICVASYGTVADVDGNTYQTVKIGSQIWTRENLKTTKYNDGTAITNVIDDTFGSLLTGAYCWYNNDVSTYKATYGALYDWYAVKTNKLCPAGWHVPSDSEWTVLTTFLGGESPAGGKLKETGTSHWISPNSGATNVTGFTALGGGYREKGGGVFRDIGGSCYLWTSSLDGLTSNIWHRSMFNYHNNVVRTSDDNHGFYVRCMSGTLTQPSISITSISIVTSTTATCGGNISSDGGSEVISKGVCWSVNQNPTTADIKTIDGAGTGVFLSSITELLPATKYYIRAYATNSLGISYSSQLSFTTLPASLPSSGLVAWFPFNGNANDESGNGNNGTVNGVTLVADRSGKLNSAFLFNGGNYIDFGSNNNLAPRNFTISGWFKASDLKNDVNSLIRLRYNGYAIYFNADGILSFNCSTSDSEYSQIYTSVRFNDNQWHHFSASFGNSTCKFYVDGTLIGSKVMTSNSLSYSFGGIAIGRDGDNNAWFYNGYLDDFGIWNRALTDQEVQNIFNMK